MALMQAARRCPQAVLLPADFEEYRRYSRLFKSAIADDRSAHRGSWDRRGLHRFWRRRGRRGAGRAAAGATHPAGHPASTGLSCSIGVAPNKLLAKLASEMDKPNGVTILSSADLAERVWPLPCRKINGVGPKASARLEQLGIRTIGELVALRA